MRKLAVLPGRVLARFTTFLEPASYVRDMRTESYLVSRDEAGRLLGCSTLTKVWVGARAMIERASLLAYVDRLCGRTQPIAEMDSRAAWLPELHGRRGRRGEAA